MSTVINPSQVNPNVNTPETFKKVIVESYRNLQNYGNTCFFSAGMQAFLHLSPIKIYLMQNQFETSSFTALRNFIKYISQDCELLLLRVALSQLASHPLTLNALFYRLQPLAISLSSCTIDH